MRALLWLSCSLLVPVAACGGDDNPGVDANGGFATDGGHLAVAGCGFDIVTTTGAEAPQPGGTTMGADPAPFQVHLGFAGDPTTSIAMQWRTDVPTDVSQVKYGVGAALDQTADGATFRFLDGVAGNGDTIRMHEVHICGLEPDTEYSYQVGGSSGGVDSWSPTYTFRTAPDITADPSASVRIGVVGDSRKGYDHWQTIAAQMQAMGVDLVIFTGDAVTLGFVQAEWDDFFNATGDLGATAPMMSVMGNHDLSSIGYFSQFALPGDEENFSFDYGHAHVTVANDSPVDAADLTGATRQFLDDDLGATTRTWKIVTHHKPFWASGTTDGRAADLQANWGPVFDAHHVDLVVNGHNHLYERTKIMNGENVVTDYAQGTQYVVTGGAGAVLYGITPGNFWTEVAESTYNFGVITVGPTMLQFDAYRPGESAAFDSFTIVK